LVNNRYFVLNKFTFKIGILLILLDDFWEYIVNEVQNWEFRIEDILLHSLTGIIFAISMKIKKLLAAIRSFF